MCKAMVRQWFPCMPETLTSDYGQRWPSKLLKNKKKTYSVSLSALGFKSNRDRCKSVAI